MLMLRSAGRFRNVLGCVIGVLGGTLWIGACSSSDTSGGESSSDVGGANGDGGESSDDGGGLTGDGGGGGGGGEVVPPTEELAETIDEEGGVLSVGYAELIVPPGALAEPTEITLRRFASKVSALDDVYEMLPSGLQFLEPARFILNVGPELAGDAPQLDERVLSYVDGKVPRPLPSNVSLRELGAFAGAVRHFSSVSAPALGDHAPSAAPNPFDGYTTSLPYGVLGKCTELDDNFLTTKEGDQQVAAAETEVTCAAKAEIVIAPPEKGKVCVSAIIPPSGRVPESTITYPQWETVSEGCEDAWNDFQKRLAEHEQRHRDIGLQGCEAAYDAAGSPPPTFCAKTEKAAVAGATSALTRALSEVLDSTQAAQDSIDVGTGHGVTLDCDCECEDKCEHMDRETSKCVPIVCDGECAKCVDGECIEDMCDECEATTKDHCPAGSSWDDGDARCNIDCESGSTIRGVACSYTGKSSSTLNGMPNMSASVTMKASYFDGCLIQYEAVSGTATVDMKLDGCTYDPVTEAIERTETAGTFAIMPGSSPYLIADCGSHWPVTVTCDDTQVSSEASGLWLYTIQTRFAPGGRIAGTASNFGIVSTFDFQPD